MLGRTPGNIVAIKPMKDGVIADFKVTEKMLNYFIQKAHNRKMLVHPRIVIGVPSEITQVEKRAVMDSAYRAKASEVHLVEQAMVAAIGAGLPITDPAATWWSTSAAAPPTSRSFRSAASSIRAPCAWPATRWTRPS
jgi:rod shape-determining protein MreB and related proteins